ncbi:cytochrome P450 2K6-like [Neovison vison]|uniref:cytochrome P450 2K6-like n=1 Tax=Neovison vison TaxID=452646 RepID=UPI001CF0B5D1|nr:cytochrome P450 2K6-like [Neogale vison]
MTKASKQHFPPGPRSLPVIGNLHILNLKRPYQTMLELSQKYGSMYSIQMGPKEVVVLSGYETVKDALVNYGDQFGERSQVPIFERLFEGKGREAGIVFSHGETWKTMRRFSPTTLRNFGMGKRLIEDRILEECQHLIHSFESHRGKPFEVKTVVSASVPNVIEKDTSTAYFSDENLVALVSNLFAAGTETTASLSLIALLFLRHRGHHFVDLCALGPNTMGKARHIQSRAFPDFHWKVCQERWFHAFFSRKGLAFETGGLRNLERFGLV